MSDRWILRMYYYERVYTDGLPHFSALENGYTKWLSETHGFVLYKAKHKLEAAKNVVKNHLPILN